MRGLNIQDLGMAVDRGEVRGKRYKFPGLLPNKRPLNPRILTVMDPLKLEGLILTYIDQKPFL